MKPKVGILTFHNSDNFGALLQTFGTVKSVEKLGVNPEVINYHSPNKKGMYTVFHLNLKKSIKSNLRMLMNVLVKRKKYLNSENFRASTLHISGDPISQFSELQEIQKNFSRVIVGSDQVWNYMNTKFDKRYFLDFVDDSGKKVAYAASFALNNIENRYRADYSKLLDSFKYISVREARGKEIVHDLTGKSAVQTVDPTLLLSKQEWQFFSSVPNVKKTKRNYVLLYTIGMDHHSFKIAKKISKEQGLKLLIIATGFKDYFKGVKAVNPTPNEFVDLFSRSEYVVTNSFHGLVFSIIMNKRFICSLDKQKANNSRQLSLLDSLNLNERLCFDGELIYEYESSIDWDFVNYTLERERERSLEFLRTAILE
jgi:Polysaccharide pyruvyl transferase.